jgi:hypothetical protein
MYCWGLKVICKQGWLLGTWLGGLKDLKATIQEVYGYLEDKVIVPELGGRSHAFPFFAIAFAFAFAFAFSAFLCDCVYSHLYNLWSPGVGLLNSGISMYSCFVCR